MLWHAQYQSKVDKLTSQLETLVSGRPEEKRAARASGASEGGGRWWTSESHLLLLCGGTDGRSLAAGWALQMDRAESLQKELEDVSLALRGFACACSPAILLALCAWQAPDASAVSRLWPHLKACAC